MARDGWCSEELDAIVEDYFTMLSMEASGVPFVKAERRRALEKRIGRTKAAIEFKHQNISAVLQELGSRWIRGYVPMGNYQAAIIPAIQRYLERHPEALDGAVQRPTIPEAAAEVFVAPPSVAEPAETPEEFRRLVRKFDPAERDRRNRELGRAGEEWVVELERRRLTEATRRDLAGQVRWVAEEEGDGAGYDVLSFEPTGEERQLEVKTTNGGIRTPFWLTRNEVRAAEERPEVWRIYRVHLFAAEARVWRIAPPLDERLSMWPEVWRAVARG